MTTTKLTTADEDSFARKNGFLPAAEVGYWGENTWVSASEFTHIYPIFKLGEFTCWVAAHFLSEARGGRNRFASGHSEHATFTAAVAANRE